MSSPETTGAPEGSKGKASEPESGLLQRIIGLITGASDPEREKKHLLKEIAKELRRLKSKFFNQKKNLAEPGMARFFFELYRTLGPAQSLLSHADTSKVLKTILIEGSMSKEQLEQKEKLGEAAIRQRAEQMDPKQLLPLLKEDIKSFYSHFDAGRVSEVNRSYAHMAVLLDLVKFDVYFLLKKFDSNLQEGAWGYNPRFEAINAQYVLDELKDFLEVFNALDPTADWDRLFDALQAYRGTEVISRESWKKLLPVFRQLKRSRELEMTVQLIASDPQYKPQQKIYREKIVEEYLSNLKMQTEMTVQKILQEQKTSSVDRLARQVFGTASVSRLSNYTEKANLAFSKRMLGGYIYVPALNYLKAFLLDYVKKDVRQVVDLLIVTGKWTNNPPSQVLSESFHQSLKISDEITQFDEAVAEDGAYGRKVKSFMFKADTDKSTMNLLRQTFKQINDQARAMLVNAGQHCVVMGRVLKQVVEDQGRKPPELILNWKEIEGRLPEGASLRDLLVGVYKKLLAFIQLLKLLL